MQTIKITEAKTADLVAFYNANISRVDPDSSAIKKFADRATAEKRVFNLVEKLAAHFPTEEIPEGHIPDPNAKPEAAGEAPTPEGVDGAANGELDTQEEEETEEDRARAAAAAANGASAFNQLVQGVQAAVQKAAEDGVKPVASRSSSSKASNSDGVAASWADNEVREARLKRDGVEVKLDGKSVGIYKSTREAFRALRLPDNKHIRFRLKLKEAHRENGESATFEHNNKHYVFSIVEIEAE
jgi:hypothetical protein